MLNYNDFLQHTYLNFPFWKEPLTENPISPILFSSKETYIEKSDFEIIQNFIQIIYKIRNNENYIKETLEQSPLTNQKSVLMSFDFHLTKDGPKLIEVNTNASHFLTSFVFSHYASEVTKQPLVYPNALDSLIKSFYKEVENFNGTQTIQHLGIIDEDPVQQKAYTEFLMYKSFFNSKGINADIYNISDLIYNNLKNSLEDKNNTSIDFIYNRHTDFYFQKNSARHLKDAYLNKASCFSPNPEEYKLLSDKNVLIKLSDVNFLNKFINTEDASVIKKSILETFDISKVEKEELWKKRKKYFFKPSNSHGSKGVYDGNKITHTAFDKIHNSSDYLVQEIAQPSRTQVLIDNKVQEAKIDFRFFVYDGVIQHMIARSYIGQTTNFRTLGCGFTPIFIK